MPQELTNISLEGVTGSINVSTAIHDNEITVKLDGELLPRTIQVSGRRLFLSGNRVGIIGALSYNPLRDSLRIAKLRLESESGLVEEISGTATSVSNEAFVDLRFKDWGLSLQQVLSLVEIPESMRVSGGIFTLERTMTGKFNELKNTYKVTINGVKFETGKLKIKGVGLLIEFP